MNGILVILIIVACFLTAVAVPQNRGTRRSPCVNTETQVDANVCAHHKFTQANAEMNRVYKLLMAELGGDDDKDQQRLRQAQLLWLQYRDANCESEASIYDGGSIRPAVFSTCMASITQERTKRMKAFLAEAKM